MMFVLLTSVQLLMKDSDWPLATAWEKFCGSSSSTQPHQKPTAGFSFGSGPDDLERPEDEEEDEAKPAPSVFAASFAASGFADCLSLLQQVSEVARRMETLYAQRAIVEMFVAWQRPISQLADADQLRYFTQLLMLTSVPPSGNLLKTLCVTVV